MYKCTYVVYIRNAVLYCLCVGSLQAAQKAGVDVQLGCNLGNCGVCELELEKFSEDGSTGTLKSSGVQVIRSCIARIPPGYVRLELNEMADQIWGVDGFDT